jgi:hypothetical protein
VDDAGAPRRHDDVVEDVRHLLPRARALLLGVALDELRREPLDGVARALGGAARRLMGILLSSSAGKPPSGMAAC